jgi:hypothetical protein
LNQYFKLSVTLFFFVGLVVLLLAETLGLWFVNTQMVIPAERIRAANWVYQCSIISFMLNMFLVPFQSMIIAFENMKIYAFAGIIEVILKLLVIYFLLVVNADKLILFAVLYLSISLVIFVLYVVYCLRKYPSCAYSFFFDKTMFKEFSSYSGWIIFGSLAGVIRGQGINIVLNLFFGPFVNAARGIAFQVERAVSLFVHNFLHRCEASNNQTLFGRQLQRHVRSGVQLLALLLLPGVCVRYPHTHSDRIHPAALAGRGTRHVGALYQAGADCRRCRIALLPPGYGGCPPAGSRRISL